MLYPVDLKYTREHEWIRLEGGRASVGVTAYAIEQLGDVVHLEPIRKPRRGKATRSEQRSLRPQMSSTATKSTKHIWGFRIGS